MRIGHYGRIRHFGIASLCIAGWGIAGALALAAPASATVVTVTYTGITDGYDYTGLFWAPGHFSGAYTVAMRFDTTLGNTLQSPTHNYAIGGSYFGVTSPALSTTVTMNGITRQFQGNEYDVIEAMPGSQYHTTNSFSSDGIGYEADSFMFQIVDESGKLPGTIDLPFFYRVRPLDPIAMSSFSLTKYDGITKTDVYRLSSEGSIETLAYRVDGVPEPASWALLVAGFAAVGDRLRRRRLVTTSRAT